MALTPAQKTMYLTEWGKVRQLLRRIGRTPKEADGERMAIHKRNGVTYKDGTPKSSSDLTNADLTRILAGFWVYTCRPQDRLAAQLRQLPSYQEAAMGRWSCEEVLRLIRDFAQTEGSVPAESGQHAYLDGWFKRVNKADGLGGANPATGTADQWHKVFLGCCYRYDQLARDLMGEAGNRQGSRYWPHNHERNLKEFERHMGIPFDRQPALDPDDPDDKPF